MLRVSCVVVVCLLYVRFEFNVFVLFVLYVLVVCCCWFVVVVWLLYECVRVVRFVSF